MRKRLTVRLRAPPIFTAVLLGGAVFLYAEGAMPNEERTTSTEAGVNLLLPEGLSPAASQALGQRLVDALAADPATARALPRGARSVVLSDEGGGAVPEGAPTLNRFIGVLTVPMTPDAGPDAVRNAIRSVPGADGVRVEPVKRFGILPGEEPG